MARKPNCVRGGVGTLLLCATLLRPLAVAGAAVPLHTADASATTALQPQAAAPAAEALAPRTEPVSAQWLDVRLVLQQPELPNGCEVTSLAMLLAYYGYDVTKTELADNHLATQGRYNDGHMEWGGDPEEVYPGNPADDTGWYCYAKPLAQAANSYLGTQAGSAHTAVDITGVSVEALEDLLRQGTPVAVWLTTDGTAPRFSETSAWRLDSGKWLRPFVNVHCAVLSGYTTSSFLFSDPLGSFAGMAKEDFARIYTQLGCRAMIVTEEDF